MARKLKCRWCGNKREKPEMVQVTSGKTNKYYCKKCYDEFLEEKETKKIEAQEKDALCRVVMEIYNVKSLPPSFYMQIEGIRHGNRVFDSQKITKRYREGYEYNIIEETYKDHTKTLIWSQNNKVFNNLSNALNYGLTIILNHIHETDRRRESVKGRDQMQNISESVKTEEDIYDEFKSSYKKKENDIDQDFIDLLG